MARRSSRRTACARFCVIVVLVWGFYDLVRWEGLDGGQHTKLSWRWAPTAEQSFLAAHAGAAAGSAGGEHGAAEPPPVSAMAGDWPQFRGPGRDSRVVATRIRADWHQHPPVAKWRRRVGPGWSSMAIVGDRLFTQEQRGEDEAVVCYDAQSGQELWAHADRERFDEPLSGPGPRATPAFADGRIYSLGALGRLNCLDASSGLVSQRCRGREGRDTSMGFFGFTARSGWTGDRLRRQR